jgi:hypothetical protein
VSAALAGWGVYMHEGLVFVRRPRGPGMVVRSWNVR